MDLPNVDKIFYIGASGKIGTAVCQLLVKRNIKICAFSSYAALKHANITYTQDITEMANYKYVIVGKPLSSSLYKQAMKARRLNPECEKETQYLLDYTVPFLPLPTLSHNSVEAKLSVKHIQIGVLKVTNDDFLRGYYDICMGTAQNQIYPCHAGCIMNMLVNRETDETG